MSAREVLQRLRREIAIDSDPLWVLNWQQAVDRGSRKKSLVSRDSSQSFHLSGCSYRYLVLSFCKWRESVEPGISNSWPISPTTKPSGPKPGSVPVAESIRRSEWSVEGFAL